MVKSNTKAKSNKKNKKYKKINTKKRGGSGSTASQGSIALNSLTNSGKVLTGIMTKTVRKGTESLKVIPLTIETATNIISAPLTIVNEFSKLLMRLVQGISNDLETIATDLQTENDNKRIQQMKKKLLKIYYNLIYKYKNGYLNTKEVIQKSKKQLLLQVDKQLKDNECKRTITNKIFLRNQTIRSSCSSEFNEALVAMKEIIKTFEKIEGLLLKNINSFESTKLRTTQSLEGKLNFDAKSPSILQLIVKFKKDLEVLNNELYVLTDPNNKDIKESENNFNKIMEAIKNKKLETNKPVTNRQNSNQPQSANQVPVIAQPSNQLPVTNQVPIANQVSVIAQPSNQVPIANQVSVTNQVPVANVIQPVNQVNVSQVQK
jgi:hypothetical protein